MFANLYIYVLANGMGRTRTELFRNSAAKNGAILLDDSKPLPALTSETDQSNQTGLSYKLRSQSSQTKLEGQQTIEKSVRIVVVVDENTIKSWENFEKALAGKKFFASLKRHLEVSGEETDGDQKVEDGRVVSSVWMSECLKLKMAVDTKKYEIRPKQAHKKDSSENPQVEQVDTQTVKKRKLSKKKKRRKGVNPSQ